uniref:Short/branched chain specific acyl-CoA dehydrogenase, mitochondrial n=1 Tax=Meloidogyne enterolobii TaxID=390850 RepID=A0A6V7Y2Y0_MELEN|nr:unnamed protein product [Meloidogyne enterolobii]
MGIEIEQKYGGPRINFFNLILVIEQLAKVVRGGIFCLSEVGSGSDAFALKTVAVPKGDDFLISGTKMWITNAGHAKFFLVMANADPSKGYKRNYLFLVDRDSPGLTVARHEDKLGIRQVQHVQSILMRLEFQKVQFLENMEKDESELVPKCLFGCWMFDLTVPYLQERKQFGKRIIDFKCSTSIGRLSL